MTATKYAIPLEGTKTLKAMKSKSTFNIAFLAQKGKLKANGKAPIMCRITVNGESTWFSTKLSVLPNRWVGSQGLTVGRSQEDKETDAALNQYRALITTRYNEMVFRGEVATADKVKRAVTNIGDTKIRILEVCDKFISDYEKILLSGDVVKGTYQRN